LTTGEWFVTTNATYYAGHAFVVSPIRFISRVYSLRNVPGALFRTIEVRDLFKMTAKIEHQNPLKESSTWEYLGELAKLVKIITESSFNEAKLAYAGSHYSNMVLKFYLPVVQKTLGVFRRRILSSRAFNLVLFSFENNHNWGSPGIHSCTSPFEFFTSSAVNDSESFVSWRRSSLEVAVESLKCSGRLENVFFVDFSCILLITNFM
jgi:hypothetical protein